MKKFFSPKVFIVVAVFSWDPSGLKAVEPAAGKALPVQIHVRHEAQIAASNVDLGAIADITSTDESNERALASIILGESPQNGKAAVWTAAEISKRLHPYSRILQDAQIKLPDQITIRRAVSGLTRENLKTQFEDSLKATLPDSSWEARVGDINVPAGIEIPRDGSVQVVPPMMRPHGATQLEVVVVAGGQIIKRLWIPARISYFAKVPILTRGIEARSRIMESDISWVSRDVTYMIDVPATGADFVNAVARMNLVPGMVVNRSQLEREMAVRFGDTVELLAGGEDFSVTLKGVAQQNAFLGDTIRVKNVAANKVIDGIVTAPGTVRVRF